jgi:hypothetical protein
MCIVFFRHDRLAGVWLENNFLLLKLRNEAKNSIVTHVVVRYVSLVLSFFSIMK